MSDMNEWARRRAEEIAKKQAAKSTKEAQPQESHNSKKELGTALWHEIRRLVKEGCETLNANLDKPVLAYEVTQNSELRIAQIDSMRRLFASFDGEKELLTWETTPSPRPNEYQIKLDAKGKAQFIRDWDSSPLSVESIAEEMLNALLNDD